MVSTIDIRGQYEDIVDVKPKKTKKSNDLSSSEIAMYSINDIRKKIAILVASCDNYSDLWNPFFQLFWRFWPECPLDVFLLSNSQRLDDERIRNVLIGDDISWSDNLRRGILQLPYDYIFLFLDDLFLCDFVDASKVLPVFNWVVQYEPNCVSMNESLKPDKPFDDLFGTISKGTIYRATTVLTLWKKEVLLDLLKAGESAWAFEINGTVRSDKYDGFYSAWQDYFCIKNGVIKGKWQDNVLEFIQSHAVEIDLAKRPKMNKIEAGWFFLRKQRARLLNFIPSKYRRGFKHAMLLGRYKY